MTKRPESVLVVVYTQAEDVLLMQRRDHPDFWQSITGSLEGDETITQAAWRELKEETGLSASDGALTDCQLANWFEIYPQWRHRYAPNVTQNKEHVFTFAIPKIIPITLSHEHLSFRWLSKDKASIMASSPSNQAAILKWIVGSQQHGRS